jgi:hypothetical protein
MPGLVAPVTGAGTGETTSVMNRSSTVTWREGQGSADNTTTTP